MSLTIAIAIHEGVQPLDVAGPLDVFAEANRHVAPENQYETFLLAENRDVLKVSSDMSLVADYGFQQASRNFDIVLVAGRPGLPDSSPDPSLCAGNGNHPARVRFAGTH